MTKNPTPEPRALIFWLGSDPKPLESSRKALTRQDYHPIHIRSTALLGAACNRQKPDLFVVDLDGFRKHQIKGLVRQIRRHPRARSAPLLFLTRADAAATLSVLRSGADDYLLKPFDPELLAARLEAALSTAQQFARPQSWSRHLLRSRDGQVLLDLRSRRCHVQTGIDYEERRLTSKEFEVLAFLLRHPNRVVHWEDFFKKGWKPRKLKGNSRTLVQHVMRLRRHLGPLGKRLEAIAGLGYRWND